MKDSQIHRVAVIDIGKTNAKVALVDLISASEVLVRKTANKVLPGPPYPHFDCAGLFEFVLESLEDINRVQPIEAISVTTHGATAALVAADGSLALPVLDYEYNGPDKFKEEYGRLRPTFAESGSPRLPGGLNLGAQIYWQARAFPEEFAQTRHILTYPQYWSYLLTGKVASEVTSLGSHTDLWDPWQRQFSSLVVNSKQACGVDWLGLFPPVMPASTRMGSVRPELLARIGIGEEVQVYSGIHDSNASLLPYLKKGKERFSVVSTGTWVISLSVGGEKVMLDPARDTLVNVSAFGEPIPTARFIGGREFDILTEGKIVNPSEAEIARVLKGGIMRLPSVLEGAGPFPRSKSAWADSGPETDGETFAAASFYCALMTATCLDLVGAEGPVFVEGPFAGNDLYCAMLGAALQRDVVPSKSGQTGTSLGAAMLAGPATVDPFTAVPMSPHPQSGAMHEYAEAWQELAVGAPQ
jgi:sugar (pentulose or hexulose) kinase